MYLPIPWKMEIKTLMCLFVLLLCARKTTNEILTNLVGHLPTIAVLLFIIINFKVYNYCSSYSVYYILS